MKKIAKNHVARNAKELGRVLYLDPAETIDMEFRAKINKKIIETIKSKKLTHSEVAKMAKASRTRVTALLNGHTRGVSTDMLLRILYCLGYKAKISFTAIKLAA